MKKLFFAIVALLCTIVISCQQDEEAVKKNDTIPQDITSKMQRAGFDTSEGFSKYRDGYLVEYDIFLTEAQIDALIEENEHAKNGRVKHYRTTNLVSVSTTRTLNIYMDPGFDAYMQTAFDNALSDYNGLNLSVRFQRVTNSASANIQILAFFDNSGSGILGMSAGFPSGGNPASPISLNTFYYNASSSRPDARTVIAHEIGHAIGFRHTDYMNRTFSCNRPNDPNNNEGSGSVGAVHIPGTPTDPSANSWMLACSNNTFRPFTTSDVTALRAVYPPVSVPVRTIGSPVSPNVYLRVNGTNVTAPNAAGSGIVNCQYNVDILERFRFRPQPDGTYVIESNEFPNVYVRMDGTGITASSASGGGTVNCQYGSGALEKFNIVKQSDGTYTINSVAFPNIYLRMDGSGVTSTSPNGGGTVNCQFGASTNEKFIISPDLY